MQPYTDETDNIATTQHVLEGLGINRGEQEELTQNLFHDLEAEFEEAELLRRTGE